MQKESVLARQPLFRGLSPEQLSRLLQVAVERPARKGEVLFLEHGEASGFYLVLDGLVKIFRAASDGRETVLHLYGPGNVFGEVPVFAGGRFPASAMAVEDSRVLFLPREALVRLLSEDATLALNMLGSLSMKLREFAGKIESLTVREIPERLAAYLLDASEREKNATVVSLDVSKGLLAGFLGATRETLSRALSRMADQGLIEVRGRDITLLDKPGLTQLAAGLAKGLGRL